MQNIKIKNSLKILFIFMSHFFCSQDVKGMQNYPDPETENFHTFCNTLIKQNPEHDLNMRDLVADYAQNKRIVIPENNMWTAAFNLICRHQFIIPTEIGYLNLLQELQIIRRENLSLPIELGMCVSLKILILQVNQLTSIPTEIGFCLNLRKLNISVNALNSIPTEIGNCSKLKYIDFDRNLLTSLPTEIGNCPKLEVLIIADNQLTSIPSEIGLCTSLKYLILAYNQLTFLPTEIGYCTRLKKINLYQNGLCSIPESITSFPQLEKLDLRENPLPISILENPEREVKLSDPRFQRIINEYFEFQDHRVFKKSDVPTIQQLYTVFYERRLKQLIIVYMNLMSLYPDRQTKKSASQ